MTGRLVTFPGCTVRRRAVPAGPPLSRPDFLAHRSIRLLVNANGLALRGIQFNYQTPYTMSGNFTLQYQLTPTLSVQAGYVTSLGRHLEVFPESNNPTADPAHWHATHKHCGSMVAQGVVPTRLQGGLPFPDFGATTAMQPRTATATTMACRPRRKSDLRAGLNFLATYTWSKTLSDAVDLLNGGSNAGYRAPDVPGSGSTTITAWRRLIFATLFHLSGGYELPFGKGKHFMTDAGVPRARSFGGWSVNSSRDAAGRPTDYPHLSFEHGCDERRDQLL